MPRPDLSPRRLPVRLLCRLLLLTLAGATSCLLGLPNAAHAAAKKSAPEGARHQGTKWVTVDLATALAQAKRSKKRVLIKFEASWCGPCRRLARDVFHTPSGARLTRDLIAVKVDFDAPANRPFIERYVVLGLPTTVVVSPEGEQVLRIMGYDGKAAFERVLATASAAVDPVPALRKRWQKAPGDDANRLALGKALLVRGAHGSALQREAFALLEGLIWRPTAAASKDKDIARAQRERAAEVLFTLGRFHHRVRRDPGTAQHLWRELATRFGATSWAGGAWWWFARSQAELGRIHIGRDVLRQRARRAANDRSALSQWISFAMKHHIESDRAELLTAAQKFGADAASLEKRIRAISAVAAGATPVK